MLLACSSYLRGCTYRTVTSLKAASKHCFFFSYNMSLSSQMVRLCSDGLSPYPGPPIFPSPIQVLSASTLPGRGPSPLIAWMLPTAHYSAMDVGGGGVATRGRCYDEDTTAVYCSSGPHVLSQMWPENAKNEACFPLYLIYVCPKM